MSCLKESDLHEWLINDLAVQWLRLQASTAGTDPLKLEELRSYMPQDTEEGKKKKKKHLLWISVKLYILQIITN